MANVSALTISKNKSTKSHDRCGATFPSGGLSLIGTSGHFEDGLGY